MQNSSIKFKIVTLKKPIFSFTNPKNRIFQFVSEIV